MGLLLDDVATRFGVAMHDQVTQFVRDVEALAVMVRLIGLGTTTGRSRLSKE